MARARFDVVTCVVARRVRYGLVVEIGPDEPGWIETEYMAGDPARPQAWPAPGTVLTAVVLGTTRGGRVRLCALPGYVDLVRSSPDPAKALADLTPEEVRRLRGLPSG
jgi:hypothetical protein